MMETIFWWIWVAFAVIVLATAFVNVVISMVLEVKKYRLMNRVYERELEEKEEEKK